MLDVVQIKSDQLKHRIKANFGEDMDDDAVKANLRQINEGLLEMPFDKAGEQVLQTFQTNLRQLWEFLSKMDKKNEELLVFDDLDKHDPEGAYSNIKSVQTLMTLLKNYRALVEIQDQHLKSNLQLAEAAPSPNEINAPDSRFKMVTEAELSGMTKRLEEMRKKLDHDDTEME